MMKLRHAFILRDCRFDIEVKERISARSSTHAYTQDHRFDDEVEARISARSPTLRHVFTQAPRFADEVISYGTH